MWKFILWWHFLHDIKARNAKHNLNYYWNISHSEENFVSMWIKIVTYLKHSLKCLEVLKINRDDNKFWTWKKTFTFLWKLPQTIASQYNIGRLIFCIKGSRCSLLIFYICINICPHLYRWLSLYRSHILHSLYNKHDVHMRREAQGGSGEVFDGCEHGEIKVALGFLWNPQLPFTQCHVQSVFSHVCSFPSLICVITEGVWHLRVGVGQGQAMGDPRCHRPAGTAARGKAEGRTKRPISMRAPRGAILPHS